MGVNVDITLTSVGVGVREVVGIEDGVGEGDGIVVDSRPSGVGDDVVVDSSPPRVGLGTRDIVGRGIAVLLSTQNSEITGSSFGLKSIS